MSSGPGLDRLWAGWRSEYVESSPRASGCVFCALLASDEPPEQTHIIWRHPEDLVFAVLNAFPYGTGHVLVLPGRHLAELPGLSPDESTTLWQSINDAVLAVDRAYASDGLNIGFNLGAGSGAGIPGHLHAHVLPRWTADTNFMTATANARVLPETLDVTWRKLHDAWPS